MPGHFRQNRPNFEYIPNIDTLQPKSCYCANVDWHNDLKIFFAFFLASGIQPVMVSLRRSHTNVSDFTHGGRGVKGGGYCRPRVEPRYWNEGCELQTTGMTYALARSRSNIAALGLNPEAVYHRNPHQINQIPGKEFCTTFCFAFTLGLLALSLWL